MSQRPQSRLRDRGSQYTSSDYQALLKEAGIVCSMSRRGNCIDNAPVESFFATLKRELVHRRKYEAKEEARTDIFRWIEVWYNHRRHHSALGNPSPAEFEKRAAATAATVSSLPIAA